MRRRRARSALLALVAATAGCHSLARIALPATAKCGAEVQALRIWIEAPGPRLSDGDLPLADAVVALVLYPWDVVSSAATAVRATYDPDLAIRFGPAGALAGIALPWLTLMPYVYPPYAVLQPPEFALEPPQLAELVARVRSGDGVAAFHALVGEFPWEGGAAALVAVELATDNGAAADVAIAVGSRRPA